jgi:phage virion morphogenesis protein
VTGASITVSLQGDAIGAGFRKLQRIGHDPAPLLRAIGVGLVETTQRRFEMAQDPHGRPWAPLLPAYAAIKRGPGILRGAGMRGGLMGSITFATSAHSVRIGSNKVYAAIHQFGGTIKPVRARRLVFHLGKRVVFARQVQIPARPYLGFGPAERLVIEEAIAQELRHALGNGA